MSERSGFPSMTALLGLLAVAGYQNRDKIGEMLKDLTGGGAPIFLGTAARWHFLIWPPTAFSSASVTA